MCLYICTQQWNCKSFMCPFCKACRDGPLTWKDFSLTAPWKQTCRDHAQYELDVQESAQHNFRRGPSPLAFKTRLAEAPHFRWTMVKCDWMHAPMICTLVLLVCLCWYFLSGLCIFLLGLSYLVIIVAASNKPGNGQWHVVL